jgi:hypothetical protein
MEFFSLKAIKAIIFSRDEARRLGHNFVGTGQILLGLLRAENDITSKALRNEGLNLGDTRIELDKIITRHLYFDPFEITFTSRAKRVLDHSIEESRAVGCKYASTEHIFLSLLEEEEGVAWNLMERLEINVYQLRENFYVILDKNNTRAIFRSRVLDNDEKEIFENWIINIFTIFRNQLIQSKISYTPNDPLFSYIYFIKIVLIDTISAVRFKSFDNWSGDKASKAVYKENFKADLKDILAYSVHDVCSGISTEFAIDNYILIVTSEIDKTVDEFGNDF